MGCIPNKPKSGSLKPLDHIPSEPAQKIIPVSSLPLLKSPQDQPKSSRPKASSLKISSSSFIQYKSQKLELSYEVLQKLGEGFYGYVRLAIHKESSQKRAVKSIEKSKFSNLPNKSSALLREFEVLKGFDHPNIVRAFECFEDSSYIHLVTEYISGGQIIDFILSQKTLSESLAAEILLQVISGISYCHSKGIVHRDLQSSNILIESNNSTVKIIGFGNAALLSSFNENHSNYSNISFTAPEVIKSNSFDNSCDMWSCGVIMYLLISGKLPFYGKSEDDIKRRVAEGQFSLKSREWLNVSEEGKDLVKKLLCVNVNDRITAKNAVEHPWFNLKGKEKIANPETLKNLSNFRFGEKFQQAVSMFIASHIVSKENILGLNQEFRALDLNSDGKISKDELILGYLKVMNREKAEQEVNKIMALIDSDESGFIDYSEFITACLKEEIIANQENLGKAFKSFDSDGSGKLTIGEIENLLGASKSDTEEVRKIMEEIDIDHDGEIGLNEFMSIMMKHFTTGL